MHVCFVCAHVLQLSVLKVVASQSALTGAGRAKKTRRGPPHAFMVFEVDVKQRYSGSVYLL
jgi:hypothetical protein